TSTADQTRGVAQAQSAGRDQRRIFAQAVPRDEVRPEPFFRERAKSGDGSRQNRRLRVRRELQILLRAVEAEIAQTESQRPINLVESGASGGGAFRQSHPPPRSR